LSAGETHRCAADAAMGFDPPRGSQPILRRSPENALLPGFVHGRGEQAEDEDITAALEFAARATDHPVIMAAEP
jgi:hypothetical protein